MNYLYPAVLVNQNEDILKAVYRAKGMWFQYSVLPTESAAFDIFSGCPPVIWNHWFDLSLLFPGDFPKLSKVLLTGKEYIEQVRNMLIELFREMYSHSLGIQY